MALTGGKADRRKTLIQKAHPSERPGAVRAPTSSSARRGVSDAGPRGRINQIAHETVVVLCTTEMGLCRYGKRGSRNGDQEDWEESVLLKAKVALPSLLADFVREQK